MTRLDCSVVNCTFNKDYSCCKDNIHVGGRSAKVTDQTCCESFQERKGDGMTSGCGTPHKPTEVSCDAVSCTYNQSCRCHADQIRVNGANACRCEQTECSTFCCK